MHPNVSLTEHTLAAPSHSKNRNYTINSVWKKLTNLNEFFFTMPIKFTFICRTSSGTVSPFSIDRVAEVMCLKKTEINDIGLQHTLLHFGKTILEKWSHETYCTLLSETRCRLWLKELLEPRGMKPIGILLKVPCGYSSSNSENSGMCNLF